MGKGQYQYTLQGSDMDELYTFAKRCEADLARLPELTDVGSDLQISNPQLNIQVDRDRAATLRVSVAQIESALHSAFGRS
jgi:HAE1 family hydrophobic/amphiphilic exporter-1